MIQGPHDPKSDPVVSPHGQTHVSHPEGGHGSHADTLFEGTDASVRIVVISLVLIAATLVVTLVLTVPIQKTLRNTTPEGNLPSPLAPARIVPPDPQLQVHPWEELPVLRARENQVLQNGGKDSDGREHSPIAQAVGMVVSRLTIAPDAPVGLTTPGGQGRDFTSTLNSLPAPYRAQRVTGPQTQPQIRGEIRKNAK